jgi:hypothetical protein
MAGCPDYRAAASRYQQLDPWTPTSPFDCTAYAAAWLADEHTCGSVKVTGRQVRLASSEPVPDPKSPGLNLPQADAAVYRATGGKVNLQLGSGGTSPTVSVATAKAYVEAGRSLEWQFHRGRLGQRVSGLMTANGFTGLHAGGLKQSGFSSLRLFDPLVRIYLPLDWDDVRYAAIDLSATPGTGRMNVLVARDNVPSSYSVTIKAGIPFSRYRVENGVIVRNKAATVSATAVRVCSRRMSIYYPAHDGYRNVVRLLSSGDPDYPFISTDSPAVTYREHLP